MDQAIVEKIKKLLALAINKDARGYYTTEQAALSALMDIRDELKAARDKLRRLNALLHCGNFQRIPAKLDRIGRNTEKKKRSRVSR